MIANKAHFYKPMPLLPLLLLMFLMPGYSDLLASDAGIQKRSAHLLEYLKDEYTNPWPNFSDSHKHYWSTGIAFAASSSDGIFQPQLNDGDHSSDRPPRYWGIIKYDGEAIPPEYDPEARGSGNNTSFSWNENIFHFILPGLAWLMGIHPDIPAWDEPHHREPELTYREIYLKSVLSRTDNYNAFTGEGTENHINMSRPSAWVLASEAVRLDMDFPDIPYSAKERAAQMRNWMLAWSRQIYHTGIGEWDSGTYHMVSIQGWLTAFEYAGTPHGHDPAIRDVARAVLDYYAATMALKHTGYHIAGAEMRSGRNYSRMDHGTSYLAYLWFGDTDDPPPGAWRGNAVSESVFAAASSYHPPEPVVNLARRENQDIETYQSRKPSYLLREQAQAVDVIHITPSYTLGSANIAIGGFHSTNWQIVPWKLLTQPESNQRFPDLITGNGGFYGIGRAHTKDPWMQLVQHENVLLQMHRVPFNAEQHIDKVRQRYQQWLVDWYRDFTNRWINPDWGGFHGDIYNNRKTPISFLADNGNISHALVSWLSYPESTSVEISDHVVFLEHEAVYVAIRSLQNSHPVVNGNEHSIADHGSADNLFGLVIETGYPGNFTSFDAFRDSVMVHTWLDTRESGSLTVRYQNLSGDLIEANYQTHGSWQEPEYDWSYGVSREGGVSLLHKHPWKQPYWPEGDGHGRMPTWSVNGREISALSDFRIKGPRLVHRDRKLTFYRSGEAVYYIDYQDSLPLFYPGESLHTSSDRWGVGGSGAQPFTIYQNYPNPFNPATQIRFELAEPGHVTLTVYDMLGKRVATLADTPMSAGQHEVTFDATGLSSGTYLYRISSGNRTLTRSMLLMK